MEEKKKTKNKGGRPPKTDSEKAKNKVTFYLPDSEYDLLKTRSEITSNTYAGVVKNAVLKDLIKDYREPRKFTAVEMQYLNQLNTLGSTLNQIAKKLNSGIELEGIDTFDLVDSIDNLNSIMKDLKNKI